MLGSGFWRVGRDGGTRLVNCYSRRVERLCFCEDHSVSLRLAGPNVWRIHRLEPCSSCSAAHAMAKCAAIQSSASVGWRGKCNPSPVRSSFGDGIQSSAFGRCGPIAVEISPERIGNLPISAHLTGRFFLKPLRDAGSARFSQPGNEGLVVGSH